MTLASHRPLVMGIVNVTPDSFSGDGIAPYADYVAHAMDQALRMIEDGAGILDIGGESSRPGSAPVEAPEEIRRTAPVIQAIRKYNKTIPIAIDTVKAEVADAALQMGASMVNDISALAADPAMGDIVKKYGANIVLMHNRGRSDAVHHDEKIGGQYEAADYADIVQDVARDLSARAEAAQAHGIAADKIILDPGIGFGKTPRQNLALITHLASFKKLGYRVLMGPSRKSFIGHLLNLAVDERLEGTAACITACILNGADIVRVHDVAFMTRVVRMAELLRDA